jgi:hypothetical protein
MTLTLKSMALTKYGTLAAFAEAAGRTKRSARNLLDPGASLRMKDLRLLIKLLDITDNMVDPLFFGSMFESDASITEELLWLLKHRPELIEPAIACAEELLARQEAETA